MSRLATAELQEDALRGTKFVSRSIVALTAGQAAGTEAILPANAKREALMIRPASDCELTIAAASQKGWPLFGDVPNTLSGSECPTNQLFVYGLAAGASLTIWEG